MPPPTGLADNPAGDTQTMITILLIIIVLILLFGGGGYYYRGRGRRTRL